MAPFTPYITEEIYQTHFAKNEKVKSVHLESWPTQFKIKSSKSDEATWNKMLEIITKVRQAKSEAQKSMKAEIVLTIPKEDYELVSFVLSDLKAVCNAKEVREGIFNIKML
jgi:valyl-tRNA synthetase